MTGHRERGQATVEFALLLPLVVMVALAVVQVALIVRDHVGTVHAAREAARAASVDPDPTRATRAARHVLAGNPASMPCGTPSKTALLLRGSIGNLSPPGYAGSCLPSSAPTPKTRTFV